MNYVFGPVPSRRLGQSLGIDTIPLKTCNWNCVYCQLGRTVPLTNERCEYFPRQAILDEVKKVLVGRDPGEINWITFVGSGEPTLHRGLGWLIREVKTLTDIPVALITNGSLLYLSEVRDEILPVDAVLPTLDAGTAGLYKVINRPHPDISLERLIEGLNRFRGAYKGKLWIEVMLVEGLNDDIESLEAIAGQLALIQPDEIHLNLPTRPPAETWVKPPDADRVRSIQKIIESRLGENQGKTIRVIHPTQRIFNLSYSDSLREALLGIITRHPIQEEDLLEANGDWSTDEIKKALADLETSGQVQIIERHGQQFWTPTPAFFPDDAQSRRTVPKDTQPT